MITNALISSKELYYDQEPLEIKNEKLESSYLTERKDYASNSPSKTGFSKRHTNFMTRYSTDNKLFSSDIIETKNKRIKELEAKLKDISELLYELASKVQESLKLEDVSFF